MSSPNPTKLGLGLLLCLVVTSLSVPVKGGLYLTNFEGDALHLADIVLRMAMGQGAHADFMTPLGSLAFWPFVPFQRSGLPGSAGVHLACLRQPLASRDGVGLWLALHSPGDVARTRG